jgi:hypothetical protein
MPSTRGALALGEQNPMWDPQHLAALFLGSGEKVLGSPLQEKTAVLMQMLPAALA